MHSTQRSLAVSIALTMAIPLGIPTIAVASEQKERTAVVTGTLVKMIVDYAPQSRDSLSTLTHGSAGNGTPQGDHGTSTSGTENSEHQAHSEEILHAMQVGDATLPIADNSQLLTAIPSGSPMTVELSAENLDLHGLGITQNELDRPSSLSTETARKLADGEALDLVGILEVPADTKTDTAQTTATKLEKSTTTVGEIALSSTKNAEVGTGNTTEIRASARASGNGNHQVFIALPSTKDAGSVAPPSKTAAHALISGASDYWQEQTYNRLSGFQIAKTSQYTSGFSRKTMCDLGSSASMLRIWAEAAQQTGYKPGARKHLVVLTGDCKNAAGAQKSALGVAEIGASLVSGGRSIINDSSLQTLVHELGHNFSLGHSNLESVYRDAQIPYFGMYSPMAATVSSQYGSIPSLDIAYQHKLGVLPKGMLLPVIGSQTIKLVPISQRSGLRGAYFHLPTTGQKIFIEYRSGTLSESNAFYLSSGLNSEVPGFRFGPGIRVYSLNEDGSETNNDTGTFAREGTRDPANSNQLTFLATLRQGETLKHFVSGFSVTAQSINAQGATLAVSVPKAVVSLSAPKKTVAYGYRAKVRLTIDSVVPTGGAITAYYGSKKVGSATVPARSGSQIVTLKLKNNLPVGKNKIKLKYSGSGSAFKASRNVYITVNKAKPKLGVKVIDPYLKYSTKIAITASSGRTPTGKATVYLDGKRLKTVTLKKGAATVALPKRLSGGKHKVTVKYSGTSRFKPTTKSISFKVTRKVGKISGLNTGKHSVKVGKKYSDSFKVNDSAVIQRKSGSRWVTVKSVKAGTHKLQHVASKAGTKTRYRVLIKGTNRLTGVKSKTLVITDRR